MRTRARVCESSAGGRIVPSSGRSAGAASSAAARRRESRPAASAAITPPKECPTAPTRCGIRGWARRRRIAAAASAIPLRGSTVRPPSGRTRKAKRSAATPLEASASHTNAPSSSAPPPISTTPPTMGPSGRWRIPGTSVSATRKETLWSTPLLGFGRPRGHLGHGEHLEHLVAVIDRGAARDELEDLLAALHLADEDRADQPIEAAFALQGAEPL